MKKILIHGIACALSALAVTSCNNSEKGWSVSGDVAGLSNNGSLVIEGFNNGMWYVVDSVKTSNGSFEYNAAAPAAFPEVMRLGLNGRYIYFPVDSIDHITITTDSASFGTSYKLDGTLQARNIQALDSALNASVAKRGVDATISDNEFKKGLFTTAFDDPSVMSVYYLINKTVGNKPLFDINNSLDLRLYGATAQRFATERPDDPRTAWLADVYKRARAAQMGVTAQVEAKELSLFDIKRSDNAGKVHSLAQIAGKGKVVVLSFTAYGLESSPAYNVLLNKAYEKYRNSGLEIFQIAFDGNETSWKQTAKNLPWITVWNSTTDDRQPLIDYNVGALPMTFIIGRDGAIAARVADPAKLESELAKFM